MTAAPRPAWGAEALWEALEPELPGLSIEIVERLDSTNSELLDRLRRSARLLQEGRGGRAADEVRPQLLVAIHQTAGRGRLGRRWHATPGASLTFSLALALERPDWSGLSLAVGLAVAEALDPAGLQVGLKWPNDLMLRRPDEAGTGSPHPIGRKVGGILVESVNVGPQRMAVVGVGINVQAQRGLADDTGIAALSEFQPDSSPPALLTAVVPPIVRALGAFQRDGFAPLALAYARRDVLQGLDVTTSDAALPAGVAAGVSAAGALRLAVDGQVREVVSGEVSIRPANG